MARHFGQTASFHQTKSMTYLTRVRSNCRRWAINLATWIALLPLDEADHLGHRIFRWDRKQHVHVIGHQMPLLNFRVLLKRELAEHFAQMPSQLLIQRLSPTFRDEDNMIFAVPSGLGSRTRSSAEFLSCEWLLTLELR